MQSYFPVTNYYMTSDNERTINSSICLMIFAPVFFLVMPIYVGTLADAFHADLSQIGRLTASELAGAALASMSSLFWIKFANLKRLGLFCSIALVLINGFCTFSIPDFHNLLLFRLSAGIFEGGLLSIADFILGRTQTPDRFFAFGFAGQMILSGILLSLLPFGIRIWGAQILFAVFGASALPAIICSALLKEGLKGETVEISLLNMKTLKTLSGLLGMAAFYSSETVVWAFLERIGTNAGLSKVFLGMTLGLTSVIAVVGGITASWLAGRVHRLSIMIASSVGQIICLVILDIRCNEPIYFSIAAVYQILWCLWLPFQMGAISASDPSKRLILLSSPFQAMGIAVGPAIISFFINANNLFAIYIGGIIFAILSVLLFLPISLRNNITR